MNLKFPIALLATALSLQAEPVSQFDDVKETDGIFEMQGVKAVSSEFIPIQQSKTYRLRGAFKNPQGVPAEILFGIVSFDSDHKEISVQSVSPVEGTDTVLAENCFPEDKIIRVKDASSWTTDGASTVAFDTKPGLKDLPNSSCATSIIGMIAQNGDAWEIRLKGVAGRDYSAGTPVRQHFLGNTYVFAVMSKLEENSEWKEFEGTFKQSSAEGLSPFNTTYLRPGTAFVKIVIVGNPSNRLEFRDIEFSLED